MERLFRPVLALAAAACLLSAVSSTAKALSATEALAREALDQALSMPAGEPREKVLGAVSGELRRRHRDVAIEAARAMREPFVLQSFEDRPDRQGADIAGLIAEQDAAASRCRALASSGLSAARLEEEVSGCFLDLPAHCDFGCPRLTPDEAIAMAAALPIGEVRRDLLLHALGRSRRDDEPDGARRVVAALRALKPQLPRGLRDEVDRMLADPLVDLLDGRHERAFARLRRADFAGEIAGAVYILIRRGELDHARTAWALLAAREGCIDPETVSFLTWPEEGAGAAASLQAEFVDGLPTGGAGPCPGGVGAELRARLELGAERLERALAAADHIADPHAADEVRLSVARVYLRRFDDERARPILAATADRLTPLPRIAGSAGYELAPLYRAAERRAMLAQVLAWVGETERAVRVARSFEVPGWRAWALALVADNVPGPGGTGPREIVMQISGNDVAPLP